MLGAAILSALALQAAAPGRPLDAFDLAMAGKSVAGVRLAEAMDKGFDACGRQIANRKYLSSGAVALKKDGLTPSTKPPAEIAAVAATVFKQSPVYAQVPGAAASVWVIGSPSLPMCRVIVADTSDVPAARKELASRFAAAKSWSPEAAQSYTRDGVVRQAYILNREKAGPKLLTFIDGPGETTDGGKGIQAIITVGVTKGQTAKAEAKKPETPKAEKK